MARRNTNTNNATAAAAPQCQVCGQQPPKYKCPGCALRYCSVACCQAHKAAPCPGPGGSGSNAGGGREGSGFNSSSTSSGGRKRGREDARWPHPASRRGQQQQRGRHDEDDEEEDLEALLTPEMQAALRESKWLHGALGDSTLRRLLADIDGGGGSDSSALAGRGKAGRLREALEKYPDLQAFVDRMLMEVGALRYEDGRLVFA